MGRGREEGWVPKEAVGVAFSRKRTLPRFDFKNFGVPSSPHGELPQLYSTADGVKHI
jgi:hypothetical protein